MGLVCKCIRQLSFVDLIKVDVSTVAYYEL